MDISLVCYLVLSKVIQPNRQKSQKILIEIDVYQLLKRGGDNAVVFQKIKIRHRKSRVFQYFFTIICL